MLLGEAGIGKTSLLAAVQETVRDLPIVRAQAYATEAELPFALLESLVGPLPTQVADLEAIAAHSRGSPADPLDQRQRYHSLARSVLRSWALEGGVLVVIDDLHWADSASLTAIGFLARRLEELPVLLVASLRPWPADAHLLAQRLEIEGHGQLVTLPALSERASLDLLETQRPGALSPEAAHEAWVATAGNPYLLVRLAEALAADTDLVHTPAGIVGRSGTELITRQLDGLSRATIHCAEIAAVLGAPIDVAAMEALAPLDTAGFAEALDTLIAARVLTHDSTGALRFTHDLLAETILLGLPPGRRRLLHAQAFEFFVGRGDIAIAAQHALRAPLAGDSAAVRALELAGASALAHGAVGLAAHLLGAAVRLARPEPSTALLVAHADALFLCGQADSAVDNYTQAARRASAGRTGILAKRARALAFTGRLDDAIATLDSLTATEGQHWHATEAWTAERAHLVWERDGPVAAAKALTLDLTTRERSHAQDSEAPLLEALAAYFAFQAGDPGALATLERVAMAPHHPSSARSGASFELTHLITSAWAINECHDQAEAAIDEALAHFQRTGALRAAVPLRILKMGLGLRQGDYAAVLLHAEDLAEDVELDALQAPHAALLHAGALTWSGALDRAAELIDTAERSTHAGSWFGALNLHVTKGEHLLCLGQPHGALEEFRRAQALASRYGIGHPQLPRWCAGAIEACLATGAIGDLESVLDWLAQRLHPAGGTWSEMVALGGAAARATLLGHHDEASELYEHALSLPGRHPLDQARIGLRYGRWLRLTHRTLRARPVLAESLRLSEAHGIVPVAHAAAIELAAAGGRRRARPRSRPGELTPQETRAATLAAHGATVKEIADAMYLSPRTVETHLSRAYRKLGVSSKRQLRQLMTQTAHHGMETR
jgi:DNA-binding CsgD family transcriptional regulator/tetratricopeptide (TPR) repeat protein